jgi:predicted benzoate:H+ symporter BenE
VIQAINEVIDMHEKRVSAGVRNRIPGSIWIALFIISTLTMITMGTQVGLTGKRRLVAIIPLALAFAALATVVVDLDRPQQGLITVSQQAMVDLQESMNSGTK